MKRRLGLQAKMTSTYVLVTAVAVLIVEAVMIGVVAPGLLSRQDLTTRVRATESRLATKLSVQVTESGSLGDLGQPGVAARPGTAQPDQNGGVLIPQITSPGCDDKGKPQSFAVLISPQGKVLATSYPGCFSLGEAVTRLAPGPATALGDRGGTASAPGGAVVWAASSVTVGGGKVPLLGKPAPGATPPVEKKPLGLLYVQVPASGSLTNPLGKLGPLMVAGLVLLGLTLPVGLAFGFLATRRLIKRLRGLAATTMDVAGGDFDQRVPVSGNDEVAQLEQSFNLMAEQLAEAMATERRLAGANARHDERSRIARELHDSISQDLFSLSMLAGGLRNALPADSPLRPQVETMAQTAAATMQEMQALLLELRPLALEDAGLVPALEELCRACQSRLGVEVVAELEPVTVAAPVEHAVLRIAQEALANALKHADPHQIRLRLRSTNGQVAMEVSDDGRGFDPETAWRRSGLGLRAMRERVEELGGSLEIDSDADHGTRLRVILPVAAP